MVGATAFACVLFWLNTHCYASPAQRPTDPGLSFLALLTSHERGVWGVVCSGAIIHESFVLTAANCFYSGKGEPISYQHKVLIANDYKDIQKLIPYPRYFLQTWANDVGLIQLAEKLVFGPLVSRMGLARKEDLNVNDVAYTPCWIMSGKKSSFQLESVKIAPQNYCRSSTFGRFLTKDMVCARANKTYTVDSGAPLLKGGRLYGVASRQRQRQLVFGDVLKVRGWIINTVLGGRLEDYFANYYTDFILDC